MLLQAAPDTTVSVRVDTLPLATLIGVLLHKALDTTVSVIVTLSVLLAVEVM